MKGARTLLYADDTNIIVTTPDYNGYKLMLHKVFHNVNTWFRANMLNLNVEKKNSSLSL
jgi:hypothetical protein